MEKLQLSTWADECATTVDEWVHFELLADETKRLARIERFCDAHNGWNGLANGVAKDIVSQLYGEEALLFKDKINFKAPGGGGFRCHQDATAYDVGDLASHHISCQVCIDAQTKENGCL